ncbi:MAG: aminotransferase class I/II-fold pyridoxal phosphate-dependent enzyme, partial [Pseudomonadota bacterium]
MRNSSRSKIDPFIVMDVMEAAASAEAKGRSIVHMEVGQPGTLAPKSAQNAVKSKLANDPMGYSVALGLPELREGIARLYADWYGVSLDPARVIVTSGSSAGFILAFTALFDSGQAVGIGAPGYPSYRQILKALDLRPINIETSSAARFQPTPEQVSEAEIQGLLIASPSNPSGTMLDRSALGALIQACHAKDTAFISDEIYHGVHYDRRAVSALEISDDVYVI